MEKASLIQRYINTISEFPVLSKEEERRLIKMAQDGDEEAKEEFIKANLKLVVKIVFGSSSFLKNNTLCPLDFIQEGNIALFRAIEKFDLQKPYKFSTYAVQWIKCAIFRMLNSSSKTIRIQKPVIDIINRYYREVNEVLAKEDRMPSLEEIAEKIKISVERIRRFLKMFWEVSAISINSPLSDELNSSTLEDITPDKKTLNQEEIAQLNDLKRKTRKMLSTLTPREEKVLRMRFGVGEKRDYTLHETGDTFSISHERIRQIEAKAFEKLKKKFTKRNFKLEDYL